MGQRGFSDALDHLDSAVATNPIDPVACRDALYSLAKEFEPGLSADALRRMVAHCLNLTGLGAGPALAIKAEDLDGGLAWAVQTCFEALVIDQQGRNRDYIQSGITRRIALGRTFEEWDHEAAPALPHIPLEAAQARDLIAPFLAQYAAQLDTNPFAHIHLCWQALEHPVPPFDTVIRGWLAELDQRRGTTDLAAIDRAMALATLAEEGRQRLSWENCEKELLPQLDDPHPLVAAAAGRYLGVLFQDPEEMIVFSTPIPLTEMLERLAKLPRNRRVVAGGFLQGFDAGMDGPFGEIEKATAGSGFDVADWTLDILSQSGVEPFFPSAQAFWFYVHEGFCFDPEFVTRMIDAGHLWEAMMTATEMHERVAGMEPVLQRLVALDEEGVSHPAQDWLDLHYGAAD